MTLGAADDYGRVAQAVDHPRREAIGHALSAAAKASRYAPLATMLYGSYARRTETTESDIDILQVVSRAPTSFELTEASVTQYTPASLRILAREGSLFVLHLRTEGLIVADDHGILKRVLGEYKRPDSYDQLKVQLAIAAAALNPNLVDAKAYLQALARLGIYLLRTVAYVRCIELGHQVFEVSKIGSILQDDELIEAINKRRLRNFDVADIVELARVLERYLPKVDIDDSAKSVEALAVRYANARHASALLSNVLTGAGRLNYTTLALPPVR